LGIIKNNFKSYKLNLDVSSPYISVIIPVYNRTQYVGEAINSVLNQTLDKDKYEIIVVTNVDLPEREGVKIIKSNERWLGPKIAEGILNARGEVICLLEDDDLFLHNKLETVYKVFKEHPELGLFKNPMTRVKYIGEKQSPYKSLSPSPTPKNPIYIHNSTLNEYTIKDELRYEVCFYNSTLCFRKNPLLDNIEFMRKVKILVDMFLGLYFLSRYDVMIWNSPLSMYRVTGLNTYFEPSDFERFIKKFDELHILFYKDHEIIFNAVRGTKVEHLSKQYLAFEKILAKFSGDKTVQISIGDITLASTINKYAILVYLASFLPISLKRIAYRFAYSLQKKALSY